MNEIIKKELEKPETVEKFSSMIGAIKKLSPNDAQSVYQRELWHLYKEMAERAIDAAVTPISVAGVFLDVVSNGLSFASGAKQVYIMTRNVKVGNAWEKRLVWDTSPDGKIYLAQAAGSMEYITKPVMVYEGDVFEPYTGDKGEMIIMHKPKIPRPPKAKIIAGYVFIVRKNGSREAFWMDMNDISRLAGYSARQNGDRGANALYGSQNGQIDAGFFGAKLIKHALKNVRKRPITGSFHEEIEDQPSPAEVIDIPHTEELPIIQTQNNGNSASDNEQPPI